eukprot:maker-scaffold142_size315517-snap-gene-2.27 protein:Tk07710 transcript:maker-scaffold142_size315517-snap-gene-2.27-mRNA-1 annotation:"centaurin gamma isoform b"
MWTSPSVGGSLHSPGRGVGVVESPRSSPSFPEQLSHSHSIRHEIQRFESVHPSIYAIYDLIELIPDPLLAQQVREHVVSIEDSFVNSQEWTLSRGVPDLRLGIVGSLSSGKSALVHRYLTGSYMQEESPEGGRFKKEVSVGDQSYLLLIRDEGGPPEHQFSRWVDAVIFVFSLESEASFQAIQDYFHQISHFRSLRPIPLILVGTKDVVSESRPRVIDDARARRLARELNHCAYYETCATYGLNVERVFQEACQKIMAGLHPEGRSGAALASGPAQRHSLHKEASCPSALSDKSFRESPDAFPERRTRGQVISPSNASTLDTSGEGHHGVIANAMDSCHLASTSRTNDVYAGHGGGVEPIDANDPNDSQIGVGLTQSGSGPICSTATTLTPTSSRKNRRRSNLFTPHKKTQDDKQAAYPAAQLGSGRSIPIRQGYLYKKSSNSFSREWKKKYVTLSNDGKMTYHASLHDYMENVHGKEILLQYVTVKVPGQKPRGSRIVVVSNEEPLPENNASLVSNSSHFGSDKKTTERVLLTGFERIKETMAAAPNEETTIESPEKGNSDQGNNGKKRLRKLKNNGTKTNPETEDLDNCEFHIVSLDNRQWQFETPSVEDRDIWINAIEQQILSSIQGLEVEKTKSKCNGFEENCSALLRTQYLGNLTCADCGSLDPDWASINMGVLICIECSGVHRQLGSHISRVRSLELDEWPNGHIAVMTALGNRLANSVTEDRLPPNRKPGPTASQKDKEVFIIAKYKDREFLMPLPNGFSAKIGKYLAEAITRSEVSGVLHGLLHCYGNELSSSINPPHDERTPLNIAYESRNVAISQLLIWAHAGLHSQSITTNPKDEIMINRLEKSFFTFPTENGEFS